MWKTVSIDKHPGERKCGWDTVISNEDYNKMFDFQ